MTNDLHGGRRWITIETSIDRPLLDRVIEATVNVTGIGGDAIIGPRRTKQVCRARYAAAAVMRARYSVTFEELGEVFNGRDHSTLVHSIQQADLELVDRVVAELDRLTENPTRRGLTAEQWAAIGGGRAA